MGMNRQADIGGVRAHFDCQRRFRDEVSRRRSDDAAPNNSLVFFIEQDLGNALIAA